MIKPPKIKRNKIKKVKILHTLYKDHQSSIIKFNKLSSRQTVTVYIECSKNNNKNILPFHYYYINKYCLEYTNGLYIKEILRRL
jgi:hypothetical protein